MRPCLCARNVGSSARVSGEHTEEVRLHHAPDLGVGQILKHAGNRDTGIVHHRVEGVAGLRQDGLDRGLDRRGVGDVEPQEGDALGETGVLKGALEEVLPLEVAHGGEDAPAAGRQKFRGEVPEARRCSGDQDSWHRSSCRSREASPSSLWPHGS